MIAINTQHHEIIRHLYHEVAAEEKESFRIERLIDPQLDEEYESLREIKAELDQLRFEPSDATIEKILAYSRSTAR